MQFKSILLSTLVVSVTIFIFGCNNKKVETEDTEQRIELKNSVQAILTSGQTTWEKGKPLTLFVTVANNTNENVAFDGRMAFPGNINVYLRLPNSKVISASAIAVHLVEARKKDLIELEPGRLYGSVLTIEPIGDPFWNKELLQLKPGVYRVWIVYYSMDVKSIGCSGLSLTSNEVEINVK